MSIETLDDILTEIADRIGVYGAHGDEDGEGADAVTCTSHKPCRPCFESDLRHRIEAAIEVEKTGAAGEGDVSKPREDKPKCSASDSCPMTAGYYVGGGLYICWFHALTVPGCMDAVRNQELTGLERGKHV